MTNLRSALISLKLTCCTLGIENLGSSQVVLNDGSLYGGITKDGSFVMYVPSSHDARTALTEQLCLRPGVPAGTHLLSVRAHDYAFDLVSLISRMPMIRP